MEDVPRFLTSTLTWALTVEDRAQSEAAAHLVAATLNKHASSAYRCSIIASN